MTPKVPAPAAQGGGWLLLAGVLLAALTEAVAGTVMALGRFDLLGDTQASLDQFVALDVAYVGLKLAGFLLTPWLLTRWTARDVLLAATLAMGAACGLAAATSSLELLTALRAAQGGAGAAVLVSGQVLLFRAWPRSRQPLLQAVFAAGAVVAPATLALALQGWLIDTQSWPWIFLGVVPVALMSLGLLLLAGGAADLAAPTTTPFDTVGAALIAVLMLSMTYVLGQGSRWDWFESPRIVGLSLLALVAAALLAARPPRPGLFDLAVFRSADFAFAFLVSFVAGAALLGSAYLIPAFAVSVLAFTPTEAGLLLIPSGGSFIASLLLCAWLFQVRKAPPIATVPAGILLFMTAMAMLSGGNADSGADSLGPALLIRGFGLGFLFLSITLIAFGGLPDRSLAYGVGLFNAGRQLGGLIGIAGLQTLIDRQTVANQVVLGANVAPGSVAVGDRIAATAAALAARGVDAGAAAKVAVAGLGRVIGGQATVIAFDTAFAAVALLFVVAAPLLVASKVVLARLARRRAAPLREEI